MVSFGYLVSTELPFLHRAATRPAALAGAALCGVLACGCSDSTAGRLTPADGGRTDGGQQGLDAGVIDARPDGGPVLPVADREVILGLGTTTTIAYTVDAAPAMLDVHLSIDTTGSFVEEIDALQSTLAGTVIPAIRSFIPASSFGLSSFQDFPLAPFGTESDHPYLLLQRVTSDLTAIGSAVKRLPSRVGNGGDLPESGYEALFQAATGDGLTIGGRTYVPRFTGSPAVGGGTLGGAGFREDSFKVIVHATDAISHVPDDYVPALPGVHGAAAVQNAFRDEGIRLVGITNGGLARRELEQLALATGSYVQPVGGECPTGEAGAPRPAVSGVCPLVFDIRADGTGLSDALVTAISNAVAGVEYASVRGAVLDDRLGFVEAVHASEAIPPSVGTPPGTSDATPLDGYPDTFTQVAAGTTLTFDVILRNDLIASQTYAQTFRFRLRIQADEALVVDEWIRVVVPALP